MSEYAEKFKPLITVIVFLGIFTLILQLILMETPSLFVLSADYSIDAPDWVDPLDLLNYVNCENETLEDIMGYVYIELGGWDLAIFTDAYENGTEIWIYHLTRRLWKTINYGWHHMTWKNVNGKDVSSYYHGEPYLACQTIDNYYKRSENSSKFIGYCDHFHFQAFFNYDVDTYDNSSDALRNNDLNFLACLEWDQQNTGMNAFSFISSLLVFKLPDIHPVIQGIIALPIIVSIAYVITYIILDFIKSLPFT